MKVYLTTTTCVISVKVSFENFRSVHPSLTDDNDDSDDSDDWDDSTGPTGIVICSYLLCYVFLDNFGHS